MVSVRIMVSVRNTVGGTSILNRGQFSNSNSNSGFIIGSVENERWY